MYDMIQTIQHISKMEIRPTGLLDPNIEVRGTEGQVNDLLSEINQRVANNERCLITVLTIKFAEEVSEYLNNMGIKSHHLHSEIDTIERSEIINALRIGHIDVISQWGFFGRWFRISVAILFHQELPRHRPFVESMIETLGF